MVSKAWREQDPTLPIKGALLGARDIKPLVLQGLGDEVGECLNLLLLFDPFVHGEGHQARVQIIGHHKGLLSSAIEHLTKLGRDAHPPFGIDGMAVSAAKHDAGSNPPTFPHFSPPAPTIMGQYPLVKEKIQHYPYIFIERIHFDAFMFLLIY
jgi:hypothetical protein